MYTIKDVYNIINIIKCCIPTSILLLYACVCVCVVCVWCSVLCVVSLCTQFTVQFGWFVIAMLLQEVSFEPQPNSTDPTCSTDAMLVFPLSEHGLISVPIEIEEESEVDLQTQLSLHLLILTWLTGQAANNCTNTVVATVSNDLVLQELEDDSELTQSERGDHVGDHFRITGLLQTIYDGRPSLLVGVCVSAELKSSSGRQGKWFHFNQDSELINTISNKLTTRLHSISLNKVMRSVINNDKIRTLIEDRVLDNLEQIGQLPLTSFLSAQEDTAPLTTLLSFYWHSSYHISSLPTNESLRYIHSFYS